MTHYYLYIEAGLSIDSNSRFYKVGIGESEVQCKKRAWLESYAYEHGHFFVRWSLDAVEFLARCLESVNKDLFDVLTVKADDICAFFNGTGDEPAFYQSALNRHRLLKQIDPSYYTSCMLEIQKIKQG